MHRLNHDRELILNGKSLILTNGNKVTVVNDRGYQLSVKDPSNNRPLLFITPAEIATINSDGDNFNDKSQPERNNSPDSNSGRPSNLLGNE